MSEEMEVAVNPIEGLIQAALDKNYTGATDIFNDVIGQKMQSALDHEKIAVADQIYNGVDPGPEDDDYIVADPDAEEYSDDDDVELDDEDLELADEELEDLDDLED